MTWLDALLMFVAAVLGFMLGSTLTAASYAADYWEHIQDNNDNPDKKRAICDFCKKETMTIDVGDYTVCYECCAEFVHDYFCVLYPKDAHKLYTYMSQVKEAIKKWEGIE